MTFGRVTWRQQKETVEDSPSRRLVPAVKWTRWSGRMIRSVSARDHISRLEITCSPAAIIYNTRYTSTRGTHYTDIEIEISKNSVVSEGGDKQMDFDVLDA